jgi:hypothetical protein
MEGNVKMVLSVLALRDPAALLNQNSQDLTKLKYLV